MSRQPAHNSSPHSATKASLGTFLNLAILCDLYHTVYVETNKLGRRVDLEVATLYGYTALAAHVADYRHDERIHSGACDIVWTAFLTPSGLRPEIQPRLSVEELAHGMTYANFLNHVQKGHAELYCRFGQAPPTYNWLQVPVPPLKDKLPLVHLQEPKIISADADLYPHTSPHDHGTVHNYRDVEFAHNLFPPMGEVTVNFSVPELHVLVLEFLHDTLFSHTTSNPHLPFLALLITYEHEKALHQSDRPPLTAIHTGLRALYLQAPRRAEKLLSKETMEQMYWKGRHYLEKSGEMGRRLEEQVQWHLRELGVRGAQTREGVEMFYKECLKTNVMRLGHAVGKLPEGDVPATLSQSRSSSRQLSPFSSPPPEARHSLAKRVQACTPVARRVFS